MSAVEALAEVLVPHSFMARYTVNTDGSWTWKCSCGHEYRYGVEIADQEIQHRAEALVAAIRSMPAEQVAELIDGEVSNCWKVEYDDGSAATFWEETEAREYADECRVYAGDTTVYPAARAVTPWLPLGVSPETNGEQK